MLREVKPVIRRVIAFLIVLILVTIAMTLLFFRDSKQDIFLNLFSEMMGTGLSIFCIDQLLKLREEIRHSSTRYLWYTKLFGIVDELLSGILPPQYYQRSHKIYHYKRANLILTPRLDRLSAIDFGELVSHFINVFDENSYQSMLPVLVKIKYKLDNVIERSSSYYEESQMILLLNFERSLERVLEADFNWSKEGSRQDVAKSLSIMIEHAVKINLWLREVIDSNFTLIDSSENHTI